MSASVSGEKTPAAFAMTHLEERLAGKDREQVVRDVVSRFERLSVSLKKLIGPGASRAGFEGSQAVLDGIASALDVVVCPSPDRPKMARGK